MKVLVLSNDFVPNIGGIGIYAAKLAAHLVKAGHEVTVLAGAEFKTLCQDHEGFNIYEYNGAKVVRFYIGEDVTFHSCKNVAYRADMDWGILTYQYKYLTKAVEYLNLYPEQYDVIHGNHILCCAAYRVIKDLLKIPFVFTFHTLYKEKSLLKENLSTYIAHNCDAALCVSKEVAEYVRSLNPDLKVHITYNAIEKDIDSFTEINHQDRRGILYCGRLEKGKGIEELIEAYKKLSDSVPSILQNHDLLIVGEGKEEGSLRDLCKSLNIDKKVFFLGKKPYSELREIYLNTLCLVIPSEKEGFSTVALEAMEYGACVIASDIPSFREMITHRENGILTKLGSVPELAEAIREVLCDAALREKLTQAAYLEVEKKFVWPEAIKEITSVYEEVIFNRKSR